MVLALTNELYLAYLNTYIHFLMPHKRYGREKNEYWFHLYRITRDYYTCTERRVRNTVSCHIIYTYILDEKNKLFSGCFAPKTVCRLSLVAPMCILRLPALMYPFTKVRFDDLSSKLYPFCTSDLVPCRNSFSTFFPQFIWEREKKKSFTFPDFLCRYI